VTEETWVPPALRYKEIADTATTAAKRMHRYEAEQVERLQEELPTVQQRVTEAEARRDEIIEAAQHRWHTAMEALWDERWMQVTPFPEPEGSAMPTDRARKRMQAAYFDLHEALHRSRSWWPAGRDRHGE
jgi:hypothetical protein